MRHNARYCIGGWPTISVNRSAKTERERPTSRASRSTVHGSLRLAVQRGQRLSDHRIAQSRQPAGLGGRERLEVAADRLDEHQLRETRQDVLAARTRAARLLHGDVQQRAEPSGRRVRARRREVDHRRQRGEQRIVTDARRSPGSRRRPARARRRRHRARRRSAAASTGGRTPTCRAPPASRARSTGRAHRPGETR